MLIMFRCEFGVKNLVVTPSTLTEEMAKFHLDIFGAIDFFMPSSE
jgi:hypothetical protein